MPYHSAEEHNCYRTGNEDGISTFLGMACFSKLHEQM